MRRKGERRRRHEMNMTVQRRRAKEVTKETREEKRRLRDGKKKGTKRFKGEI